MDALMSAGDMQRAWTEIEAETMRRDFREFVRGAWHVVEPGVPFVPGFHIDAICDHLVYVSLGDITDLVINVPPRHSKSTLVAVLWPAWEWTWKPSVQWLYSTYAQDLTVRDSVKCRRLVTSPWYQERWGWVYQISGDLNQKKRFDNDKNGYRLATSVEGQATGEGGDRIVVDDPHNMKEIHSDVKRAAVLDWWKDVMSTRANNPKRHGRVIIAQRGHHMDLCGHVLAQGGWVHLNLPGYFKPKNRCKTMAKRDGWRLPMGRRKDGKYQVGDDIPPLRKDEVIFTDPRVRENELLCPERFGAEEMAKLAAEMTEMAFAAQIQQEPSAEGGNILKKKHWREWSDLELPKITSVVQVYDTAFEEEEENDFSARTTWGVFEHEETLDPSLPWVAAYKGQKRLCLLLLERMNKRLQYPDLREDAIKSFKLWKPDKILIEKKASGHSLKQELRRAGLPVSAVPVKDSKFMRAHAASLVLERGCVFYVRRNWALEVIEQCGQFPAGEHDDIVDTVTMALLWLRKCWNAEYLDDDDDEVDLSLHRPAIRTYGGIQTGAS
jgi:predicted phage terminase large subunit-like protein